MSIGIQGPQPTQKIKFPDISLISQTNSAEIPWCKISKKSVFASFKYGNKDTVNQDSKESIASKFSNNIVAKQKVLR